MNFLGIWIAVAAIAVATLVSADTRLNFACRKLSDAVVEAGFSLNNPKTYEFAKGLISESSDLTDETRQKALADAWDDIYYGRDCSEKSWGYMAEVSQCSISGSKLEFLISPLKEYVKKCFSLNELERRIKLASESSKVDFIDSKFIEKYRNDKPNALKENENKWWAGPLCCEWYNSPGALTDAIERNLVKGGKDPKTFFVRPKDVSGYLKEKLFQPCDNLRQSFDPEYFSTIAIKEFDVPRNNEEWVSNFYQPSLSQKANEAYFRYKYCSESKLQRVEIVKEMLKKFLPELEPTNDDKSMIVNDCLVSDYDSKAVYWE